MSAKYKTAVVACARWEENYIVEWVQYYKCIGYEHIYLYCNDDDPAALYEKVLPFTAGISPFVTFVHFKYPGLQYQMYMHFILNYGVEVEWVSFFDVDEFLRIANDLSIEELLENFDADVDCILFNWVVFGTSGHKKNPSGKVLENYTRTEGKLNEYTKFICRSKLLNDPTLLEPASAFGFWHNLYEKLHEEPMIVNVLGEKFVVNTHEQRDWERIQNTAVLHHYFMKSEEYAFHRIARGTSGSFSGQSMWDPNSEDGQYALNDLARFNIVEDLSLASFWKDQVSRVEQTDIAPKVRGKLLSKEKNCNQSSVCEWSIKDTAVEDAAGAVNGVIDGKVKFHTDINTIPWWQIDLAEVCAVNNIVIYNTAFNARFRFCNFKIVVSADSMSWIDLYSKGDNVPVGGFLTKPLALDFATPVHFRFLRILMFEKIYLHLDQVEIYGESQG